MTDVIVPSLHCSLWMLHPAHSFGSPPGVFVCDGTELRPALPHECDDPECEQHHHFWGDRPAWCPFCAFPTLRPYTPLGEQRGALFCDHCYRACAPVPAPGGGQP